MNTIKKIIFAILGVGVVSAAGYEAITPADTTMSKVAVAYEQSAPLKAKYALTNSQFVKDGADKNKVKAELGEAGSKDFEPSLTFSRWNGEAKFKIKPDISKVAKKDKKLKLDGEKIKYKAGKIDYVFYDKPDASEDGGFEWEIVLNEKPTSNTFFTAIESEGVEFYKQKPLNEEQQEEGTTCTATECVDAEGRITASRPENVVDSIAVYSDGKAGNYEKMGGMNYMAGKIGQIYRIKAIDANGDWTWCDQNIAGGLWTKICPQEWLDKAAYPVVVDPTFGYTTAGGSWWSLSTNYVFGDAWTAGSSFSIDSISIYIKRGGSNMNIKGLVATYIDYYSGNLLTNGIGGVASVTSTTGEWATSSYSSKPALTSGNDYSLSAVVSNSCSGAYDNGLATNKGGGPGANVYATPQNYDGSTYYTDFGYEIKSSIYATYTTSGGAARRVIITE